MCEQVVLQVVAHFPVGYDGDLEEEGAQYIRNETLECFYPKRCSKIGLTMNNPTMGAKHMVGFEQCIVKVGFGIVRNGVVICVCRH